MMLQSSALESLVGQGKDRINETVANHAAFLLEPKPELRPAAAAIVKRLYGRRSEVVHGTLDHVDRVDLESMKAVFVACMLSLLERMRYAEKLGASTDEMDSESLWEEYRQFGLSGIFGSTVTGLMAGHDVSILSVRRLWCDDLGVDLRGEPDLFSTNRDDLS